MSNKLLIFDLDGTLADTRADLADAINAMRARYGISPLDLDTVTSYVGSGVRSLVESSIQDAEGIELDEALGVYEAMYLERMLCRTALYPGVEQGLQRLHAAGFRMAVLSNKPGDPSRAIIRHLGIEPLFFRVLGGGDLPNLKPAPDGILRLMAEVNAVAQQTWMIGDHHTDLEAARNAGVRSGFVAYGIGHPGTLLPDRYWEGFDELTAYFTTPMEAGT